MYQEERIYEILKMLKNKKTLSIHEIISIFEISRDTARRDIVKLVNEGLALRTHGGIAIPEFQTEIYSYKKRIPENIEIKSLLAEKAAMYIENKKICFLDVSTTIEGMCTYIPENIHVYTHSLDNMDRLSEKQCAVHIFGGTLNKENRFFYGNDTLEQIKRVHFDAVFLGGAAIHSDGVYVEDNEDAAIKNIVSQRADFVCVLVDNSKFFKKSHFKGIEFENIDMIMTNGDIPKEIAGKIEKYGIEIRIVHIGGKDEKI
ncbi:DeoR/GlpR family DNA-binding transcription regulator [Fusobacterium ulcerans]|jgi:DeoR/GlpR family transcriptional regulator of sugar metabolism|uniref:DeoR/GlpR family DNA-binding transcription regulator n=1 Tax=Fusobacterium ulcerans TaxID=861 RepID=UPI000E5212D0|nr:DeoR/GlpR family DNA-binding transcription regulator [Fusobacterium ulcerans]MEE0137774.1 DeoR/GlpR family DNA-binding transcription regulator [Fusobacterium ulcerans]RGY64377.1 DeoR/GlpR transcriptional regulator [Fusobacterium ulcerans]HJH07562.1 DeoR/GlpR family DNA-binding transcription regulator [Fusobacterium ulcerans]